MRPLSGQELKASRLELPDKGNFESGALKSAASIASDMAHSGPKVSLVHARDWVMEEVISADEADDEAYNEETIRDYIEEHAPLNWNDNKKRKAVDDSITEMHAKRARGGYKRIKT